MKSIEILNRNLQDIDKDLTDQIHIVGGLSNAYFAVYSVNLQTGRCRPIKNIDFFQQAVKSSATEEVVSTFVTLCVMPEDTRKMWNFTDISTLSSRLEERDTIAQEFHGTLSQWEWCRASWIVANRDGNNQVTEVLFAVEEISASIKERRKYELAHEQELIQKTQALEAANKAKSTFLFNMSHDIRTPMNAILGFSSLAQKNPAVPDQVLDYLQKIEICGQGMLALLDNVLEFSRIESGRILLEITPQIAENTFDSYLVMVKPDLEKHHHTVHISKKILQPYIYFDATRMTEIILNLLSNAIKYTADGRRQ